MLPEVMDDLEWFNIGEPPEYCIYCGFPFDLDLQLADPLRLAVPNLADRLDTLEGPAHLYCVGKLTRR